MAEPPKMPRPRRGKAQWGNRPPGFKPENLFPEDTIRALAGICGRTDEESFSILFELLSHASESLQVVKYIAETEVPIKDQRAALKILAKRARELHTLLHDNHEGADLSTRLAIFSGYPGHRLTLHEADEPIDSLQLFNRDVDHLEQLTLGLESALQKLPRDDGRKSISPLHNTCHVLVHVYENYTDEPFKWLPSHTDPLGNRGFLNNATTFVGTAAQVIHPEATKENLDWAMRNAKRD